MSIQQHTVMTPEQITQIFEAQTKNVSELKKAWNNVNRTINDAYRTNNITLAKFQTRILGLIFSAYSEAIFSKLIHTPYGLSSEEISQIKKEAKRDIVQGWNKCLELSVKKINSNKSNHIPNITKEIKRLINDYIREPSLIRNKIAHGQWKVSLNRKNTNINSILSRKIKDLTVVDLYRYRAAFDKLSLIMEDIIESPNKAHWKFYWEHISDYDADQKEKKKWTLEKKIKRLKDKSSFYKEFL